MGAERQRRRAENQVWTAAGTYDFSPAFLAFHADGTPDAYLNAIVGFTHRFYDTAALRAYFKGLGTSLLVDTFTDLCWLALASAVDPQAVPYAPSLPQLREEHARRYLQELQRVDVSLQSRMLRTGVVQTLQTARCREILHEPIRLANPWDRSLYEALAFPPERDTQALIRRLDDVLHRYFLFRWTNHLHRAVHIVLPAWLRAAAKRLLPVSTQQEGAVRRAGMGAAEDRAGLRELSLLRGRDWREPLAQCGAPYFPEPQRARLESEICTGAHRGAHIFYAKAQAMAADAGNAAYYQAHRQAYRTAARLLSERIRNALSVWRQPLPTYARSGRLVSARTWRAVCGLDGRIFSGSEERVRREFDVTLLLDASASRAPQQAVVAAQAYTMAEGLLQAGLRVQVWAYTSLERVTVLTSLKALTARHAERVLSYKAQGWNRDGLALRALLPLLLAGRRHLVLCFTDAHPGDAFGMAAPGRPFAKAYMGEAAVADAADGARALRKAGVRLVGLVNSVFPEETTEASARRMFGTSFLQVRSPQDLARRAGSIIERELRL